MGDRAGSGGTRPDAHSSRASVDHPWVSALATRSLTWIGPLTIMVAAIAGMVVFNALQSADSADCYGAAVTDDPTAALAALETRHCKSHPWDTVAADLRAYQSASAAGEEPPFDRPPEIEARADIIVWHVLLGAMVAGAVAAIAPSLRWVRRLGGSWRDIGVAVAMVVVAAGVVLLLANRAADVDLGPIEGIGLLLVSQLVTVTIVLTVPVAAGPIAIRRILNRTERDGHEDLEKLRRIGLGLRWHAYALGTILTLGVLSTAGRWQTVENLPAAGALPTSVILLYGAIFAGALAGAYLPAHHHWLSQVDQVVRAKIGDEPYAPGASKRADELRHQLGADVTSADRVRSSLAILTPVLAAAITSLFN